MPAQNKIILWVGYKHSGKTTSASRLAEKAKAAGFEVAGILAPSIYHKGKLVGFDIINIHNSSRSHLADRENQSGKFIFSKQGLQFGIKALNSPAAKSADLIIVDEFGPMELAGKNWRECVDSLIKSVKAVILLVVREESAEAVSRLYSHKHQIILQVSDSLSADNKQFRKIFYQLHKKHKLLKKNK